MQLQKDKSSVGPRFNKLFEIEFTVDLFDGDGDQFIIYTNDFYETESCINELYDLSYGELFVNSVENELIKEELKNSYSKQSYGYGVYNIRCYYYDEYGYKFRMYLANKGN